MKFCSVACMATAARSRPYVEWGGARYSLDTQGYYVTRDGRKLHREIYTATYGAIPAEHDIHHRDHDRANNDLSNLIALPHARHTAHHNPVGRGWASVTCQACGITVDRAAREIRRGQDKYCSRRCANQTRRRERNGQFV